MRRLKIILQSNITYIFLIIIITLYVIFFTKIIKYDSIYSNKDDKIIGTVTKIIKNNDKTTIYLNAKEKIIVNYYDDINLKIGYKIRVIGSINTPSNNTIFNNFNYKKYLYNKKIYRTINANNIKILDVNINLLLKLKNKIIEKCDTYEYFSLFILGNKNVSDDSIYESFKNVGVAHLLAVSGMHISVLVLILNKILFFLNKKLKNIIIIIVLLIYCYFLDFSPSVFRTFISFILILINNKYNLNISSIKRIIINASIILLINPFYIYDIGFLYSFLCTLSIALSKNNRNNNYFISIISISFNTLIFTLPITINLNYEINLLIFIANLIMIPLISFIIYPLTLLSFSFPLFLSFLKLFINIMKKIILFLSSISIGVICIPKLNVIIIILYYIFILMYVLNNKKNNLILIILILFFYKNSLFLNNYFKIIFFDVGQGDSTLIVSSQNKDVILIDTGGNINYHISDNIIHYLKSLNIKRINKLIITHGDYDHMGEAIKLVNNFKVENVIFNCGEYNDLEKELIKVLDKKKIKHYSCIKDLNIDKYKLEFLNTKEYDDENDNSNVIYFNYNNYKLLFMGDAGIEKEKDILNKYVLKDIDFLKVGHHGSNTSSSDYFINSINPKYSLISVGKSNRYGHPKDEVLNILKNSKIYRTDLNGSIEIKLNKNGYKIRTCPP